MSRNKLLLFTMLAGSVAFGGRASAQDVTAQPAPAYISTIEGAVTLIRDSRTEAASSNLPLLEGDRLRTDVGRLEVFLPDGSLLHLDQATTVDLLSGSLTRLISGRIIFIVAGQSDERPAVDYQIDAAAGSVRILQPGEYRLSLVAGQRGPDLELAVVRGYATLSTDRGSIGVGPGQFSTAADGYLPAQVESFNSARLDEFAHWSADRLDSHLGYASRQYLPPEVQVYASTFDRYGTWEDVQPYGYVWYPTVEVGWRPYYDGYWRTVGPYGWTWIGYDPWCWPTHHYGRWGIGARGWFWIPGRTWGAAWVSWGIGASYVGWCPLGWNDYAVLDLSFGLYWSNGRRYDPWSAWTVVPRRNFGGPGRVSVFAIRGDGLRAVERGAFAVRREGPPGGIRTTARPFGASAGTAEARALRRGSGATPGGMNGRQTAVPRTPSGPTANVLANERRGSAVSRAPQSTASGMPPRDARPSASNRPPTRSSPPAPAVAARPDDARVRTYERTQRVPSDRETRAPAATANVEGRSPETLAGVAARTNAARRAADPAQRDAGDRVYTSAPQAYPRSPTQATESRGGLPTVQRSPAQPRLPGSRPILTTPTNERRAPESVATPRSPDRSLTTGPRQVQAAPTYQRRTPNRATSPQVSQPSRSERASPSSRATSPARPSAPSVRQAPQRTAPSSGAGRGGTSRGIRRR
jgi:hypothetical protein